jgi:hypothetical protein
MVNIQEYVHIKTQPDNMSKSSHFEALNDLEDALEQLAKQTLPVQTRGIIQNARQRLDQLSRSLSEEVQENRLAALYRVSQSLGVTSPR